MALTSRTASAQDPRWAADLTGLGLAEAWDRNESREAIVGLAVGADRRIWRGLSARIEGLASRVLQTGADAWLTGFTVGSRARVRQGRLRPFADLAVGLSYASADTPPRGTASNYLIVAGGGVSVRMGGAAVELGARWLHISNNGRQGRHRNPDIQALGVTVGLGLR